MDMKLLFPMNTRIYVIPYWVARVVRRKNPKMDDLLNYEKVNQVLSKNDIKSLLAAHTLAQDLFPTVKHKFDNIFRQWWFTDNRTEEAMAAERILENKLSLEPEFVADMKKRLYSEDASLDVAATNTDPASGFEVVALRDQGVGVVLYQTISKVVDQRELEYQLIRAVVKQLYVYEHATSVHRSFVYSMYLKTLLQRKAVAA